MDVHKEAIVIAVLNGSGKLVMETILETKACNVITWAERPQEAEDKIRDYLATFNWNLIEADKIELADRDKDYGEEFNELLAQAEVNPNAIILRRFYTYKPM